VSRAAALALALANLVAGLLNYLFQVHAAAALDAAEFGRFSAWLAQVALASAVATVIQFLSLDTPIAEPRFRRLLGVSGAVSFVLVVAHVLAGSALSPLALGAVTLVSTALLYAVVGQLQSRLRLAVVATAIFATSGFRFALPFTSTGGMRAKSFYVAQAAAAFAGVALAALLTLRSRGGAVAGIAAPAAPRAEVATRLRLARPVLLAFAAVAFPFVDVLAISSTNDVATTGAFSRIALAARIVFFGGAAILQVLLPYHIHTSKSGAALPSFIARVERWLTPISLVGAIILAAVFDRAVLDPRGGQRVWLFATCLSAALLVGILAHVQRLAAHRRFRAAVTCVAGVIASSAISAAIGAMTGAGPSVSRYCVAVLVGDAIVLLFARSRQLQFPLETERLSGA
jgi:hypothetical protein